jgi:hypothetical protein
MKFISIILSYIFSFANADLRMASYPSNNFKVENAANAIPFVKECIAVYMEPSDFEYQGLKNQRANNYDNFIRSNIDNEHDNRNFEKEVGRDMLPFRTLESKLSKDVITVDIGIKTLIPLRWNNPHSAECEINIWIKSNLDDYIVVPIKKPSCCGEGYQDNVMSFTIPYDFSALVSKIPGFNGCNVINDCVLQIYAHSVEPRTYAIGVPIIINGSKPQDGSSYVFAQNNSQILPQTVDPLLNLNLLNHEVCLSTLDVATDILSAIPRFARLVSDQFNHAYQNSNYSPYSGQQHEEISKNLQASIILKMTASNGGELGKSLINKNDKEYLVSLFNLVDDVIKRYEQTANEIFNKIKNQFKKSEYLGNQKLAQCFRCSNTGSVNSNRLEQRTYIPSFEIPNVTLVNEIRSKLNKNVIYLIPDNSSNVQIYVGALMELMTELQQANIKGFLYQPAMLKPNITTMDDVTKFIKVDANGKNDKGVYASKLALQMKIDNILKITNSLPIVTTNTPTISPSSSPFPSPTIYPMDKTLAPNPDDFQNLNFCGQTYETIDCNKPCNMGLELECNELETCFLKTTDICK